MDISTEIVLNLGEMAPKKSWKKIQNSICGFHAAVSGKSRGFCTTCFHNGNSIH